MIKPLSETHPTLYACFDGSIEIFSGIEVQECTVDLAEHERIVAETYEWGKTDAERDTLRRVREAIEKERASWVNGTTEEQKQIDFYCRIVCTRLERELFGEEVDPHHKYLCAEHFSVRPCKQCSEVKEDFCSCDNVGVLLTSRPLKCAGCGKEVKEE